MPISRRSFLATSALGASAALAARVATAQTARPPAAASPALSPLTATGADDRAYWVQTVDRLARPILTALQAGNLDQVLRTRKNARTDRFPYAPLEALGRLLAGIAPWLESGARDGAEGKLRQEIADLARAGIATATDPKSPSYMRFGQGGGNGQPLVDSAFLCHAAVRAPGELWQKLDPAAQKNFVAAVKNSRNLKPVQSNWLLFSAMVEAFIHLAGDTWLPAPVDTALTKHEEWYKGDGAYGDGPNFHWDFYNSFVIHPMLVDIIETLRTQKPEYEKQRATVLKRAQRYAAVQERMISPEGTYPVIGRSLVYRFGAFQLLAQIALRRELPEPLKPGQVRAALSAVIRRIAEFPGTFDADGYLTMGICGSQPQIAETYISPGSPYLCAVGLLPLGLPPTDNFWTAPAADWTARLVWSGQPTPIDHALPDGS